jgi:hypothetical protein
MVHVHYKSECVKRAHFMQEKYDDDLQLTVSDIKKCYKIPGFRKLIHLKQYDSWENLMLKARFGQIEKFRQLIENGTFKRNHLTEISRQLPDLAVEIINTYSLTWEQFMLLSHALGRKHWNEIETLIYPNNNDIDGVKWLLRKAVHMEHIFTVNYILEKYEISPRDILSLKLYRRLIAIRENNN